MSLTQFSFSESQWRIDVNGFLRVTVRVAKVGTMMYTRQELGDSVPGEVGGDLIRLMLDEETLADPEARQLLEGMPVCAGDHVSMEAGDMRAQIGSVAGSVRMDGPYLVCDLVITDPKTIQDIQDRQLTELSPEYIADIIWEPGEYQGGAYQGRQVQLRYSHIALLPTGNARGGAEVRVLNSKTKGDSTMVDVTAVQLSNGKTVRVVNEDLLTLTTYNAEIANQAEESAMGMAKAEETMKELVGLKEQRAQLDGRIEELSGQLEELKAQLDEAMAPETQERMANQLTEERDEAEKVMDMTEETRLSNGLPEDLKGLRGANLKAEVINRVRVANGRAKLTDDQAKSDGYVNGVWASMLETAGGAEKKEVSGAQVVRNSRTDSLKLSNQDAGQDRFNKLYGKKGGDQ